MEYSSDRLFRIWIYTVSHSTLIIRSERQYPDVKYENQYSPNVTVDIIFNGVEFISIPDSFEGIILEKIDDRYVFNGNSNHYVKAANCTVGSITKESEQQAWPVLEEKYCEL